MICLNCIHLINRSFSNGQFVEREAYCDIDGLRLVKNVSECNRMERVPQSFSDVSDIYHGINKLEPNLVVVNASPEAIPYLQKRGLLKLHSVEDLRDYALAEKNAKDAMLPPEPVKPKYNGWPKGKPRGKRK